MRTVTIDDFRRFRAALDAYQAMLSKHEPRLDRAGLAALAAAGGQQDSAAMQIGVQAQGQAATAHAKASASFEAATVAFLGERRQLTETPSGYLLRILGVIQAADLSAIAAMQARNGLQVDFNTPA